MSGKERRGGGVVGRRDRSYQTRRRRVAQTLRFTGMTAVEVLGSVDELTDGTVRSIDAATVAEFGPYRASRIRRGNVMKRPMTTNQAVIDQSKPGSGQEPTNMQRRTVIGGALVALLSFPGRVMAQGKAVPNDPFVLLLKGLYQPVVHGPNLGLSMVDLNDGSYSTTKIYPVSGIPGNKNENKAVGNFYVQFPPGDLCAYHIPGGSFAMRFTGSDFIFVPDGFGGQYLEGTFELTILEATGIYRSFAGGHNHMVDRLHFLAPGDGSGGLDEYCFCFISGS
jgi:hypothetical protein